MVLVKHERHSLLSKRIAGVTARRCPQPGLLRQWSCNCTNREKEMLRDSAISQSFEERRLVDNHALRLSIRKEDWNCSQFVRVHRGCLWGRTVNELSGEDVVALKGTLGTNNWWCERPWGSTRGCRCVSTISSKALGTRVVRSIFFWCGCGRSSINGLSRSYGRRAGCSTV